MTSEELNTRGAEQFSMRRVQKRSRLTTSLESPEKFREAASAIKSSIRSSRVTQFRNDTCIT